MICRSPEKIPSVRVLPCLLSCGERDPRGLPTDSINGNQGLIPLGLGLEQSSLQSRYHWPDNNNEQGY